MVKGYKVSSMQNKFWRCIERNTYSKQYCIVYLKFVKRIDLTLCSYYIYKNNDNNDNNNKRAGRKL